MKTTFTARHFTASQDLKDFCEGAVSKLEQFHNRIMSVDIVLEPGQDEDNPQKAELNVKIPGSFFNAKEEAPKYEQAVNEAVEDVIRQLKKFKGKRNNNS